MTRASDAEVGGRFSMLKLDIDMLQIELSSQKLDFSILLLVYEALGKN